MSKKAQLIQSLIQSFCDDPKAEELSYRTLEKHSTEWIQSHHVVEKMNGMIEKFEIQGQANKHNALQTCFHHYQQTQDHNDENYANIIHLLLQISDNALRQNNGKIFRNFKTIIKQIESSKIDERENEESLALLSNTAKSPQLLEWQHEWEQCNDELSEWSDDENAQMNVDSDVGSDDDVITDMKRETPGNQSILQIEAPQNALEQIKNMANDSTKECKLYIAEVTKFESLISALMGVDSIYFKWRKDHFVCLGSGNLMTEFCSLLEYGNYYRNCKDIIDYIAKNRKQIPLCIRSFFEIISDFLQIYQEKLHCFISSEYCNTESILELSHFMSESFVILECIYKDIIYHFNRNIIENTLQTHDLISHLYELLLDMLCDEYTAKTSTVMSLFMAAISPYFDILDEWMFSGRLNDPFKEFFIQTTHEKNIWNKYILCKERIPRLLFEDGISQSILINGKSLQILTNIQRQNNKQSSAAAKPYDSSFKYFTDMLSKYYPIQRTNCTSPKINNKRLLMSDPIKMMTWIHKTDETFVQPTKFQPMSTKNNKEMVYIPFQHIIKGKLLPTIARYCFSVTQLLLDSIDLLPHLTELRLLYFIEASDVLHTFLPSLVDILESSGLYYKFKQIRICDALQTGIQDSVYRNKLPANNISVEWNNINVNVEDDEKKDEVTHFGAVIKQINKLDFNLHIEWPLNIVIKPSVINSYNRIFKFLLQLKASKFMLERLDIEFRGKYKRSVFDGDEVIHKYVVFRHKLYLFINTFNNYCCLQIDTTKWNELIHDILHNCMGLDEICEKHNKFIQKMLQSLFLPTHGREQNIISSHIIKLLLCSNDLQKSWRKEIVQYLEFKQEIRNVKKTSLFQHEKNKFWRLKDNALKKISLIDIQFDRLYKFCLVTIDKIKNKSLSHSAINVVLHLDFNNFYSHLFQI